MAITVETTPNPNSRKFVTESTVASSTQWFANADTAASNPLANAIFGISGVANVMMLNNFVTVGKAADAAWDEIEPAVISAIEGHL